MDDVVAVEVRLSNGEIRYFITWGRLQSAVDPTAVEALVLDFSRRCALGGEAIEAHLCGSLRDACDEPYFYESLVTFAARYPRFGPRYKRWRKRMAKRMAEGHEIFYLGAP